MELVLNTVQVDKRKPGWSTINYLSDMHMPVGVLGSYLERETYVNVLGVWLKQ